MAAAPVYPHEALEYGATLEVAPGIHWLRMRLPFALNHVNLWLLDDGDEGWTIIDTGYNNAETRHHWEAAITKIVGKRPIHRMIVTHFHPDHLGLAGWFEERFGTRLWMTYAEWLQAHLGRTNAVTHDLFSWIAFWRENGLDESRSEAYRDGRTSFSNVMAPPPVTLKRMVAGEEIKIGGRNWRVIIGGGHSPEHAALYSAEANVLISGDQILPRITTNISLWATEPDGDPLRRYLQTIEEFRPLPKDVFVLPSHDRPFYGLHDRLDGLHEHHRVRLEATYDAIKSPTTATEIIPILFKRQIDGFQIGFAMGEALSHLNYLVVDGRLTRHKDEDGIVRYRRAA
jgi:glyoxylase-like metal-dependent hydrolase (beta-lactamase superfamily II)